MRSRFEVSSVFPKAGALVCTLLSLHKAKWKPRLKTRQMSAVQKAGFLSNKEMVLSLRQAGRTASQPGRTSAFVQKRHKRCLNLLFQNMMIKYFYPPVDRDASNWGKFIVLVHDTLHCCDVSSFSGFCSFDFAKTLNLPLTSSAITFNKNHNVEERKKNKTEESTFTRELPLKKKKKVQISFYPKFP